jgi:diguanylate cyclase (GGDEF)-like protein/PAS domain S-box-containing protein
MTVGRSTLKPVSQRDNSGWATRLGLSASDNPYHAESTNHQLNELMRSWPFAIAAMLPGMALLIWFKPQDVAILGTSTVIIALLVMAWVFHRATRTKKISPHVRARIIVGLAGVIGLLFSSLLHEATQVPDVLLALAALAGTSVVCTTAFSRMPAVALANTSGMAVSMAVFGHTPLLLLALIPQVICAVTILAIIARAEFNAARRREMAEEEAIRSNRLLREFETSGPGWFWETDRQGLISYISPKVAQWLGKESARLIGEPLAFIAHEEAGRDDAAPLGERTLAFYVSTRTSFSDIAVRAAVGGEERWWSVSGRPITDEYGQFRGFIGSGSDLTEQRRSEAEVSRLARFDPLTGLANRAEIGKHLRQSMGGSGRVAPPVGLMMIDLDRFKSVNDTMGHPAGDELLKQVSERLLAAAGRVGQVGRLGGDEFNIVFPGIHDRRQLAAIADGVISTISRAYVIHDTNVTIGASIGIAVAPENGATPDDLVRNADLALYAAKEGGRGIHRFYEAGMHSAAEQRRQIEQDMRRALAEGEFFLVYQPVVSVGAEKIVGFEALIRWNHPVHGLISPAKFIPIAEECGMIEPIGEWVLRTACAEAVKWSIDARVAVNVSPIQFANPKLPALVAQVLAQSRLPAGRLELEITEGVFVADNADTDRQFETLKSLGIRLALDDFGTGYSSLGYLKRAPFDKIKIDQSFVRGAANGQNRNTAIIKAIVTLAEALGMETTAEGAETQDEIELIKSLGCSHIQGFVYGKPMESAAVLERIGARGGQAERVGHKTSRSPRYRVLRTGELHIEGYAHNVRLRNISTGGATLEFNGWASVGSPVRLAITDGPMVTGEVRWISDGRLGISFSSALDLRQLSAPLAKTG